MKVCRKGIPHFSVCICPPLSRSIITTEKAASGVLTALCAVCLTGRKAGRARRGLLGDAVQTSRPSAHGPRPKQLQRVRSPQPVCHPQEPLHQRHAGRAQPHHRAMKFTVIGRVEILPFYSFFSTPCSIEVTMNDSNDNTQLVCVCTWSQKCWITTEELLLLFKLVLDFSLN